ncbi:MAG TPA: hypothetical protein VKX28_26955 [Xanthobacteraceae bacterium]|nr:hypothetical protein [Xanthobacteraceae bacterium]
MSTNLGITDREREAALRLCARLIASPDVDREVARRATWLKWRLEGEEPKEDTLTKLALMQRA